MSEVTRYRAVYGYTSGWSFSGPSDPEIREVANEGPGIDIVFASDYDALEAERDDLRAKLARAVHELGITAAQRTSYEVIEEEGGDEYSDYRGAYDIIIEQTRKALAAIEEE